MNTRLAGAAALLALVVGVGTVEAGSPRQIDDVANALSEQVACLAHCVKTDWRTSSRYRHLTRDLVEMSRHADHIHDVAHHRPDQLCHLRSDLEEMDELVEHVDELVREMERSSRSRARHHGRHHGHVSSRDRDEQLRLRRIHDAIHDVDDTLHHLEALIVQAERRASRHGHFGHHSGHGRVGGGISIGRRGSALELVRTPSGRFGVSFRIR